MIATYRRTKNCVQFYDRQYFVICFMCIGHYKIFYLYNNWTICMSYQKINLIVQLNWHDKV